MIITKYENEQSKEDELRLGDLYVSCYDPKATVINLGYLSPFDFEIKKNGALVGYLEVKVKSGDWWKYEIIPQNKWDFLVKCEFPCYMLIERWNGGKLFNMTQVLKSGYFYPTEIKRREDQPGGSKKVVKFFCSTGRDIYYY